MLLDSLFHSETINTVFSFDTYKGFEMGEKKCEKKKLALCQPGDRNIIITIIIYKLKEIMLHEVACALLKI